MSVINAAAPRRRRLGFRRVLPFFLVLLVVVSLDDIANHGAGSLAAVLSAFLHQDGYDDLRVAARGVTDKPSVVIEFFLFMYASEGIVTDDLCGAGLATELDPREPQLTGRPARFVDDAIHGVGNLFSRRFRDREAFDADVRRVLKHVRLHEDSARSDAADHARELYRSGRHFALIPLAVLNALDPSR